MYKPRQAVPDIKQLGRYIFRELNLISSYFETKDTKVQVYNVEPERPFEGQLVIADGTNWNPSSGYGTYIYRNGAWRLLES